MLSLFTDNRFHSAVEDVTTESLVVSKPMLPDGSCPHKYLAPTKEGSCVLPQRIDLFTHYSFTGGKYGAKVVHQVIDY